ncbi:MULTISPECIES: glutathione S-transferase family protein [Gammaproteobacteria]|uniref:Glutathione S-transferase n=1 Tax=Paraferrimonas haliotis TaxID=2013866 RepID=A0AA37TSR4_9GAMM|nr:MULTISPECIES: glutathione S-transferase [Gammaproteobacteria]GLS83731.1 glutathione S-transferase [Paraferrimonas haliotis]
MSNGIRIHSFPLSGHAHRVELFASIARIKHEIIHVDLPSGEHKKEPFLRLNPLGQVPVIEDGEVVISDSNAILVYLARRYAPDFFPSDPVLEAEVQKYLTLAAGEIAFGPAAARLITVFNAPLDAHFCQVIAEKALTKLNTLIGTKDFLVDGRPTIADIAVYSYVAHAPEGNISLDKYPNILRLLSNIENLDGFKAMPRTAVGLYA